MSDAPGLDSPRLDPPQARPLRPLPPRPVLPDPRVVFRAVPAPGAPPRPSLHPSWADLEICADTYPDQSADALIELLSAVAQRERFDGATVISFADLHAILAPLLTGDDHG